MRTVIRAVAGALLLLPLLTASTQADDTLAKVWRTMQNSIVVIGHQKPDHTFLTYGSGFCIYSDGTTSYFLTNEHVVAAPNGSAQATTLVVMLPPVGPNKPSYPAHLIDSVALPTDLAIVSIDVPNVHPLKISATLPAQGQDVAWGGYPYVQGVGNAHLFGSTVGVSLPQNETPQATPFLDSALVASYFSDVDIEFGARGDVDEGNSGGPVFDPTTGAVYGVIEGRIPGSPADPSQTYGSQSYNQYGLAISMRSADGFVETKRPPLEVAFEKSDGFGDAVRAGPASRGPGSPCLAALNDFGYAYNLWLEAHGTILGIARAQSASGTDVAAAEAQTSRFITVENEWLHAMHVRAAAIAHVSAKNPKLPQNVSIAALAVANAAQRVDQADARLAGSLGSLDAFTASRNAEVAVNNAASSITTKMCFF
jgi:serine protease Do